MSTTQKQKYSMGKPLIKKLYETHKKWLGGNDTKPSKNINEYKKESVETTTKCKNNVLSHKKTIHTYENIEYKTKKDESNNVTVVNIQYDDRDNSDKLQIVIGSFDKILDEFQSSISVIPVSTENSTSVVNSTRDPKPSEPRYSTSLQITSADTKIINSSPLPGNVSENQKARQHPPKSLITSTPRKDTKIPKLVKAKTCSIIESRCILKKTNSSIERDNNLHQSRLQTKTKSMSNINANMTSNKNNFDAKKSQKAKVPDKVSHQVVRKGKTTEKPTKVKELVKRLNSLTDTTNTNSEFDNKNSLDTKKPLSKATSTHDLSRKASLTTSKIPVNTHLRKTFPSTPCLLDKIENNCSAPEKPKNRMSSRFTKSVQNLNKPKLSLACDKNVVSSSQMLQKSRMTKSTQNLAARKPLARPRSIVDVSKTVEKVKVVPKNSKPMERNVVKVQKESFELQSKLVVNKAPTKEKPKSALKPSVSKDTLNQAEKCVIVAKNLLEKVESISSKLKREENVCPKDAFVAIRAPVDTLVKSAVSRLENSEKPTKPAAKTSTYKHNEVLIKKDGANNNNTLKKSETFGVTKSKLEPAFVDKSLKNLDAGSMRNCGQNKIKLDLKRTQEFLGKIEMPSDGKLSYFLDPEDFTDARVEKGKITSEKKILDYNSDNSDDSGHISNEVEGDHDEINSKVSTRSSEFFTTNLKVSNVVESESASLKPALEGEKDAKIFFRNGVISQLEAQRDERLAGMVVSLQANCRGHLARKKLQQKKLQDLAVRCIQRNVRKFMLVRDWPWWRLLVRVTPLLNVHRTEEELRAKTEELEALKLKLQKVENEKNNLKLDNDKLETKLSEMTADLAEEHSTATLAAERLDAETSDRLRLERELSEVQHKNKELQQASERLEMELIYARSDLNGISEEDEEGDGDGVYKQRYERALRELEFTRRRLQQQHEDDLEQLVGLKKQLEKKLADAYEEVEEQRQVVGQWKRKVQKLNGEMNDLKLLLEEQSSRNNLLEKKQRKNDSETYMLQDELKKEKQAKDRLAREKEVLLAEKYAIESNLADTRLELELKEERLSALQREFDEITCGGKTEEEVTVLRKQKIDCERRLQDQEEELDELAGQVQLLEQAKLRLEMTLESMRKESKKQAQLAEEELEDVRCNTQKKVKALEQQLENEHEERTLLLKEKHELERRLQAANEAGRSDRAGDEALLQRLKRDLKRTKALLRDTQAQLERQKAETPGKNTIRQLKNQLEDLECARALAVKAKQSLETELLETQALLDESHKHKSEAEERVNHLLREKSDLQSQLEENEEELAEVLKKYKTAVQQMSLDQMALQEQVSLVSELEIERNHLKDQLAELSSKLENVESMGGASSNLLVKRSELKVKELESKLELEQTTRSRLEVQISRLKETVEKLQSDVAASRVKEQQGQDQIRKLQRNLREVKEELNKSLAKESEVIIKKKELEKRCETLEAETATTRTDLRLALKRIEDLQSAIQGELEDSISDHSDSEHESYSSDESVNTFLANHRLPSPKSEKSSILNDNRRLSNTSRSSTSSNLGKDPSYA